MKELICEPADLEPGYYWFFEDSKDGVVVEKRDGESFVRFTNGRHASWAGNDDKFYGPLPTPSLEELCQSIAG
jgi:hypothetical protein